jgi:hypothetical protein
MISRWVPKSSADIIAVHHRNPAEADRRWRGRGREALAWSRQSIGLHDSTDALFAENVEQKMSNPLAHFLAARSFLDR